MVGELFQELCDQPATALVFASTSQHIHEFTRTNARICYMEYNAYIHNMDISVYTHRVLFILCKMISLLMYLTMFVFTIICMFTVLCLYLLI